MVYKNEEKNNMVSKMRVLIVGGTGYLGKRIVKACLLEGHETFVVQRPEIGLDIEKLQLLLSFKKQGAVLVPASFDDFQSLVDAVKRVDVVISAMSGVHFRSHNLLLQLKLVQAIQVAGNNIKRFMPSEYGIDPARMGNAVEPGRETFDQKMSIRKAIEEANIPFTYLSANCFAGYFAGNLSQMFTLVPPPHQVTLYGNANVKVVYVDEDDIATYIVKAATDPRTLNKTVYVRPPNNILTQSELIQKWEFLSGKQLQKNSVSAQQFLANMKDLDTAQKAGLGHFYHIFFEGCTTNFELREGEEEASKLYPEVNYTLMDDYLKIFL